ncbi:hypothetical protein ACF0H5_014531 [Mactra antiquata]
MSDDYTDWTGIGDVPPYYHVAPDNYTYCEAKKYCESYQASMFGDKTNNYIFYTDLAMLLEIGSTTTIVWLLTPEIDCIRNTQNFVSVIVYNGPLVHFITEKEVNEMLISLCVSQHIPTRPPLTLTSTIPEHTTPMTTKNVESTSVESIPLKSNQPYSVNTNVSSTTRQSDWARIGDVPPYYHVAPDTYTYCEAKKYCENYQASMFSHITMDYMFDSTLATLFGIGSTPTFVWILTPDMDCDRNLQNLVPVKVYSSPVVHNTGQREVNEKGTVLCVSQRIPTQPPSTLTSTIPERTSPLTTRMLESTTLKSTQPYSVNLQVEPTTRSHGSDTTSSGFNIQRYSKKTTSSSTSPATTAATSSAAATTSTTAATSSAAATTTSTTAATSSAAATTTSITAATTTKDRIQWDDYQLALSNNEEPLWVKTGEREYYINYQCIKHECPISCSMVKQSDGTSFCDSYVDLFRILPKFDNENLDSGHWIGGRATNISLHSVSTIKIVKYTPRSVQYQLSTSEVQDLWKELRKQKRSRQKKYHKKNEL